MFIRTTQIKFDQTTTAELSEEECDPGKRIWIKKNYPGFVLSRVHTVRFLIVLYDCCLSDCMNMMIMSGYHLPLMSDCMTVKTR